MSTSMKNTTSITTFDEEFFMPIPPSRKIVFGFLVALLIPSFLCSIYIFYQFIRRREIRQRETNLVIICLVIINFLQASGELPLSLAFLWYHRAAVESPLFCQFWCFISAILYGTGLWVMAIGSIERHLFIFHSNALKKHALFLRYIPLAIGIAAPICLYIFLVFLFPCNNNFVYFIFWCGAPCYMSFPFWQVFSWLVDHGIPMFILVITNVLLTIRVLSHKRRMQQTNIWAKNARMFIQLISVAALYAVCWLPFLIVGQINTYTNFQLPVLSMIFLEYTVYFPYITVTLCPFVCLIGLWRDLHRGKSFFSVMFCRPGGTVVPSQGTATRLTKTNK